MRIHDYTLMKQFESFNSWAKPGCNYEFTESAFLKISQEWTAQNGSRIPRYCRQLWLITGCPYDKRTIVIGGFVINIMDNASVKAYNFLLDHILDPDNLVIHNENRTI